MNRQIKIFLATHCDTVGTIAKAYGCCKNVVWKELSGIRISEALRTFISARWGIKRDELLKITAEPATRRAA